MKYFLVVTIAVLAVQVVILLLPEEKAVRPKVEMVMSNSETDLYPKMPKEIRVDGQLIFHRSESGAITLGPTKVGPDGEPLGADVMIGGELSPGGISFDGNITFESSEDGLHIRGTE